MEERRSFWARVFARLFGGGSHRWTRADKVLEYIVHRIDAGASLRDVVREEYVRRMTTGDEVDRIPPIPGSSRPRGNACGGTSSSRGQPPPFTRNGTVRSD
jgi:hypothetical protein